ncbi:hypothetical protein [Mycobacterium paragordonae]|uniref:Uncharacterized protein n=1 Tax=Mycobacterium paragordonae TaxID=1389713 RepID=A0A4V3AXS4_9MYCO|nr:hypothetical protein [Mycobacterium paragordonae]MDP7736282.1 hypothetical protein [Mycobacterium paragordonae]TDK99599.1 hypothetical protein EUA02_06500 [Mycobacterium paragordonae]TDL06049.1 hypothetical protein EUA05_17090 [Mycobacterium paragordonae]
MTHVPESAEPPTATEQSSHPVIADRHSRVDHLWAIVSITAGVVFIVAVIFFSGFFLGRTTSGPYGMHQNSGGGGGSTCPMMGSGGGMGPGMMGPGGSMEPRQPVTPSPSTPHP